MLKIIKTTLIVIAILSALILAILFLQDRTKKLEDRKYKEISKIIIESNSSNINFYKSDDEQVRVVVYGSQKDKVQIVEGTKYLNITQGNQPSLKGTSAKNDGPTGDPKAPSGTLDYKNIGGTIGLWTSASDNTSKCRCTNPQRAGCPLHRQGHRKAYPPVYTWIRSC